jgi:tRNA (cytidine/uridine-2'-O-)-methyltransferase
MRLALFEPDIPQNAGALIRLAACFGVPLDIIEPCGFLWHDAKLKRAGMDYLPQADIARHTSWRDFAAAHSGTRLVLVTTQGAVRYTDFAYDSADILILGRESAGAPDFVHAAAAGRVVIPMRPGLRSLNVAQAGAIVLSEALRQTNARP